MMEWTVSFDEHRCAALVKTRGVFNTTDHERMVADIVGRDGWRPGHRILFDHRELSFAGASFSDVVTARDNHERHEKEIGDARSAILMKSAADYGLGRQFQMLADGRVSAELQVFTDLSSANEWLCGKDGQLAQIAPELEFR
jgi:hypothetical protein